MNDQPKRRRTVRNRIAVLLALPALALVGTTGKILNDTIAGGPITTQQMVFLAGLIVALLLATVGVVIAMSRSVADPLDRLGIAATRVRDNLAAVLQGEEGFVAVQTDLTGRADEFGLVATTVIETADEAVKLAADQRRLRSSFNAAIIAVARRQQAQTSRLLARLDELEDREDDPDRLADLYDLDHLATQQRRYVENLLVLAGDNPLDRNRDDTASLVDVVRSAAAEIEQYRRVQTSHIADASVHGRSVEPIGHLLTELLDNATVYSPPDSPVVVTSRLAGDGGVEIRIHDDGIGMHADQLDAINHTLSNPPDVDGTRHSQLGLYVVALLARRLGVTVQLHAAEPRGTDATVLLPAAVLHGEPASTGDLAGTPSISTRPVPPVQPPRLTSSASPAVAAWSTVLPSRPAQPSRPDMTSSAEPPPPLSNTGMSPPPTPASVVPAEVDDLAEDELGDLQSLLRLTAAREPHAPRQKTPRADLTFRRSAPAEPTTDSAPPAAPPAPDDAQARAAAELAALRPLAQPPATPAPPAPIGNDGTAPPLPTRRRAHTPDTPNTGLLSRRPTNAPDDPLVGLGDVLADLTTPRDHP